MRPPVWFVVLLVVLALPLVACPYLWTAVDGYVVEGAGGEMLQLMMYAMPVYIVVSQWMSYVLYNERKVVAWILQALLLLMYIFCIPLLCNANLT